MNERLEVHVSAGVVLGALVGVAVGALAGYVLGALFLGGALMFIGVVLGACAAIIRSMLPHR